MKTVGRNDPCPCGSGKKYKKCHGASNVIMMDPSRYNHELVQLQNELIKFAWKEFEQELKSMLQEILSAFVIEDEEVMDLYATSIVSWAIFHKPLRQQHTVFSRFCQRNQHKLKLEQLRKNFMKWGETIPSIYEVMSVTDDKVSVIDLRTNLEYQFIPEEEQDFEVGLILIGLLVPYVQEYDFFLTLIGLNVVDDEYKELFASYTDQQMIGDYPNVLADILKLIDETDIIDIDYDWDDRGHQLVAETFERKMTEKNAPRAIVVIGLGLWKLYTERTWPIVRKVESYVAALEYVLQKEVVGQVFQTQKELAEEYGISSSTVSTHARRIVETIGYDIEELKDEIFADGEVDIRADEDSLQMENPSFTTEKMLLELTRAMEGQTFESDEEIEQFITEFNQQQGTLTTTQEHPKDIAQDLLFEAYAAKGATRKRLIKEALDIYPHSPDAYILLAEDAKTKEERYRLCAQAVVAGERDLGEAYMKENKGHFWGLVETRPYMRAKAELALTQYEFGDIAAAIATMEEMLQLNPNDNQGIRYFLLTFYLEKGQYDHAETLLEQYRGDIAASFKFNHALLNFFQNGFDMKTRALLKVAHKANPHVKDYLTGKKRIPKQTPDYTGIGDDTEAVAYVQDSGHLWKEALPLVKALSQLT